LPNIALHDLKSTRNTTWPIKSIWKYGEARGFLCRGDKFARNSSVLGARLIQKRDRWPSLLNILINLRVPARRPFLSGCDYVRF